MSSLPPLVIIYLALLFLSSVLALIAWKKGHKKYLGLSILLFVTTALEVYVRYCISHHIDFTYLYHAYIAIEYPVLCWFLLGAISSPNIKNVMRVSILVYIVVSLAISFFHYHFQDYPGLNINMEGFLQSVLCTYILFNLDVKAELSIVRNQYFWICSGILIFYGTTFFFNGVYTKILNIDADKALELFGIINIPLNIILYAFISIGIVCLLTNRKLTIQ